MTPTVDVLVVLYNSSQFIDALLNSLRRISIPFTAYFLDNSSTDDTLIRLDSALPDLPFRAYVFRSLTNNGFARGMNLLGRQGTGEWLFILNPDTEVQSGCIERLVARATTDPKIALCEARQEPRPHPKAYDSQTGETTWCTGAATLIRRSAFEEVGGFDDRIFFMYCEDIDLSWKLWLLGWKCIYVPEAVVMHYTQDILPGKRRTLENYFSFRNSLFLFYRFGSAAERRFLFRFLLRRLVTGKYSIRSRVLYAFAFADHIRYIPYLLRTRGFWSAKRHPWIRWEETSLAD